MVPGRTVPPHLQADVTGSLWLCSSTATSLRSWCRTAEGCGGGGGQYRDGRARPHTEPVCSPEGTADVLFPHALEVTLARAGAGVRRASHHAGGVSLSVILVCCFLRSVDLFRLPSDAA
uniref:Uncharacterized protein n=1 Tax=Oryza punctata TaxID=4537 RepID=A0A0E0LJZ5_ORYPU